MTLGLPRGDLQFQAGFSSVLALRVGSKNKIVASSWLGLPLALFAGSERRTPELGAAGWEQEAELGPKEKQHMPREHDS